MLRPPLLIGLLLTAVLVFLVAGLSGSATAARGACETPAFQNGLDVVFGRASTQARANVITARAQRVGFSGVRTIQATCNTWEAVLRGVDSYQQAVGVQTEARRAKLTPTVECVTAQQVGQLQAVFGTRPTLGDLDSVISRARGFGYVGMKTKRAPCGGYQAYVAGFSDRGQADAFVQTARERTGMPVSVVVA